MKLLRYGPTGRERPGLLDREGRIRSLADHVDDIDGEVLADLSRLAAIDPEALPLAEDQQARLGVPVARIGKFLAIGLNYADHAAEAGQPVPEEPILFTKATSSITTPSSTSQSALVEPGGSSTSS
jgi:2-keto-4-pentenoate hydratase/2-oxohepta-3-ene-1,7-dioic acid hydratase in catechol pathway